LNLSVTAIGRDRPGIVAGMTAALLEMNGNVDDSQMSILHGQFAVMLIVSVPDDASIDELSARLEETGQEFGLAAITVSPVETLERGPQATHVLTVYGADQPGIVHGVAELLAARGVNITDLRTRRTGTEDKPVYTLMMELAVPDGDPERMDAADALTRYGLDHDVEVILAELDAESL
jgi:glycine cleavage system transcriptional repressor